MKYEDVHASPKDAQWQLRAAFEKHMIPVFGLAPHWRGARFLEAFETSETTWHSDGSVAGRDVSYTLGHVTTPRRDAFASVTTTTQEDQSLEWHLVVRADVVGMGASSISPEQVVHQSADFVYSTVSVDLDGTAVPFEVLAHANGTFAAYAHSAAVTVVVVGRGIPLAEVGLASVEDFSTYSSERTNVTAS